LIKERTRESVLPRQSSSDPILASIIRDGESACRDVSFFFFFMRSACLAKS
jgi:hypothetical protein